MSFSSLRPEKQAQENHVIEHESIDSINFVTITRNAVRLGCSEHLYFYKQGVSWRCSNYSCAAMVYFYLFNFLGQQGLHRKRSLAKRE